VIRTSAGRYAASVAAAEVTRPPPEASTTAVTTASTTAPPTWNEVWNKLAARPCSALGMPAVAATLSDFEVLERLAESEGRKFRAQDLAEAVHLSQSALSRLVDRLARHGLVERCGCDVDRRGIYVVLTEAGERRHAEAVPTHRDVLARLLPASMLGAVSSGE
jgi:DNA-binding MarR family transcriptional regulator